jgi:hypothetical protein
VSGNKIARRNLPYLAVKLYPIVISTISIYYTDATNLSPLRGEREKACKFREMISMGHAQVQTALYYLPYGKNLAGHYF